MQGKIEYKKLLGIAMVLLSMLFVLNQAGTSGDISNGNSHVIAKYIYEQLEVYSDKQEREVSQIELIIRKLAHFIEYYVLATIVFIVFNRLIKYRLLAYACVIGITVPIPFIDEWLQSSVVGRASQLLDVWIDLFAIFWAVVVGTMYLIVYNRGQEE